ncbi:hypothetical protein BGX27_009120 [Mortierella sp. AM989]|nr:hypothetical protein BGX27_009120 [Mortierella sp. AM989]
MVSMNEAQDANCTAIYNDYFPVNSRSGYQQCYTNRAYNAALIAQGTSPVYRDVLNQLFIRASQGPFFLGLDQIDTCSLCSQQVFNATVGYLVKNLMPRVEPFYTFEFIQYWTKLVPEYNALCKTSIVQTWPIGTLNATAGTPTGSSLSPPGNQPSVSSSMIATPTANNKSSGSHRILSSLLLASTYFAVIRMIVNMFM